MSIGRGAFIVLEGCDRSGKSSQSKILVESLRMRGHKAKLMVFPDRNTNIGKVIDAYLKAKTHVGDHVIHLLFSANRWEQASVVEEQIKLGTTLIVDRYAYSGVAFSAAKQGMDLEWCRQPDIGLPRPDRVLFMGITPDDAAKRSGFGDEIYESLQFQQKVYSNFLKMKEPYWTVIDANRTVQEVSSDLLQIAEEVINDAKYSKLEHLWVTP